MIGAELITGLLAGLIAALGLVYTYWRGRTAGRAAQHSRFERYYEKLLDLPEEDIICFFEPASVKALTTRQKALLIWYFTICSGAFLQMKNSQVERESASSFMESLSHKFGCVPGLGSLLREEGFDQDFLETLGFDGNGIPDGAAAMALKASR